MTEEEFLAAHNGNSAEAQFLASHAAPIQKTSMTEQEFLELHKTNARIQNVSFGLDKATSIGPAPTAREATASVPAVLDMIERAKARYGDKPTVKEFIRKFFRMDRPGMLAQAGIKEPIVGVNKENIKGPVVPASMRSQTYEEQHPLTKVSSGLASAIIGDSPNPLSVVAHAAFAASMVPGAAQDAAAKLAIKLIRSGKPTINALRAPEAYLPSGTAQARSELEKVGKWTLEKDTQLMPKIPGIQQAAKDMRPANAAQDLESALNKNDEYLKPYKEIADRAANEKAAIKEGLNISTFMRKELVAAKLAETKPIDESVIKLGADRNIVSGPASQEDIDLGKKFYKYGSAESVRFQKPEEVIKTMVTPEVSDRKLWWQKAFSILTPSTDMMKIMNPQGEELVKRYMEAVTVGTLRAAKMDQVLANLFTNLSLDETASIVNVIDKGGVAINQRVKRVVDVIESMRMEAAKEANSAGIRVLVEGGKKVPITEGKMMFPHYYDFEGDHEKIIDDIVKNTKVSRPQAEEIAIKNLADEHGISIDEARKTFTNMPGSREKILDNIMKQQNISRGEAKKILDIQIQKSSRIKRAGHLEKARENNMPGYIQDPLTVYRRYFHDFFYRVEQAKKLGVENQIANKFVDAMPFKQQQLARGLLEAMTENTPGGEISHLVKGMGDKVTDFLTRKYMGLSVINNIDQGFYGASIRTSFKNAIDATLKSFGTDAKTIAKNTGTVLEDFSQGFSKFAKTKNLLEKSGFTKSEQFNRVVATMAQRDWLPTYLTALKKNPNNPQVIRELGYLGFGKKEIEKIVARGQFTADEASKAALRMNWQTQFRFAPAEMPMLYSHSGFKAFYHLSSFTINWTSKVLGGYVLAEAKHGNVTPLIKLIGYGQVGGEAKAYIWGLITDKERRYKWDEKPLLRIIDNIAWSTTLGMVGSMLQPSTNKTHMESAFAPPFVGYGSDIEKSIGGLLKGNLAPAARFGVRRVAVPAVAGRFGFAPAVATRAIGERLINALAGEDVNPKPKKKVANNESSSLRNIFNTSVPESLKYAPLALGVLAGAKGRGLGKLAGLAVSKAANIKSVTPALEIVGKMAEASKLKGTELAKYEMSLNELLSSKLKNGIQEVMYRGFKKGPKEPGLVASGQHWTSDIEYAKGFGNLHHGMVTLKKPYVTYNGWELGEIGQEAYTNSKISSGSDFINRKLSSDEVTKYLKGKGYDGILMTNDDVFGTPVIIAFNQEKQTLLNKDIPKGAYTALWDKKVRINIPDTGMTISANFTHTDIPRPLSKALPDWSVYTKYPETKNIKIVKNLSIDKGYGYFNGDIKNPIIFYNESSPDNFKSTMVHEVEHYIQQKEGFAQGTDPDTEQGIIDMLSGHHAKDNLRAKNKYIPGQTAQQRYDTTAGEIDSFAQELMRKHPEWSINKAMHKSNMAGEGKPIKDWIIKGIR